MTTKAMIEAMATRGYWTSPGGATPAQTLYSALIREIGQKGEASRFIKADKGPLRTEAVTANGTRELASNAPRSVRRFCRLVIMRSCSSIHDLHEGCPASRN